MRAWTLQLVGGLLLGATLSVNAATQSSFFDKPLEQRKMKIPNIWAEPINFNEPDEKLADLSCSYYSHFMVKEIDAPLVKGSALLSIVPIESKQISPPCRKEAEKNEIVVDSWSGFFVGAKDDYVFFFASDGLNGATDFVIYNGISGQRIFEDTSLYLSGIHSIQTVSKNHFEETTVLLKYKRVYTAPCL
jgi:hypothetical protein